MHTLFAAALLAGFATTAPADVPKKDDKAGPMLKLGDPAPPLTATKWLQGAEIKEFAPGKVYVVEFWATWCGMCIAIMPHTAELQAEYRSKGVTVIAFTTKDEEGNTLEAVSTFVHKRGPKLGYTFAFADSRTTHDAWMKASGLGGEGFPGAFVVGKDGKIVYMGHPMYLGLVLPKVVAGTWDAKQGEALIEKVDTEFDEVFKAINKQSPEAGLKALTAYTDRYPALAHLPLLVTPKLDLLIRTKRYDEARKATEDVIDRAVKAGDPLMLRSVSSVMRSPAAREQKELLQLGVRAAEASLKIAGDKDSLAWLSAAMAHSAAGNKAKAREYGQTALAAAKHEPEIVQDFIKDQVRKLNEE